MGWTRCVRCKNVRCDFVGRTFALIATVRPVLHRVLCSYEMITNAPKHYETHKNLSLGSNGLDRVRPFRKIPSQLHGSNFCTNCTVQPSLLQVLCCNKTIQNAPKLHKTHQTLGLWSNGVDQVRSLQKCPMRLRGPNFCINCNSSACFATCFVQL